MKAAASVSSFNAVHAAPSQTSASIVAYRRKPSRADASLSGVRDQHAIECYPFFRATRRRAKRLLALLRRQPRRMVQFLESLEDVPY